MKVIRQSVLQLCPRLSRLKKEQNSKHQMITDFLNGDYYLPREFVTYYTVHKTCDISNSDGVLQEVSVNLPGSYSEA